MGGKYDVKFGDNSLIIRLHRLCYKPRYKVGSIVTKVSPSPPTQTPLWPPPLSLSPALSGERASECYFIHSLLFLSLFIYRLEYFRLVWVRPPSCATGPSTLLGPT